VSTGVIRFRDARANRHDPRAEGAHCPNEAARFPVRPGSTVRNLLSGETITFRRTSGETAGEVVQTGLELRPLGAPGGLPHRHLPSERFDFVSGAPLVWIQGRPPRLARPGEVIEVPSRRWHFVLAFRRTRAEVSVRPGMRFDELLACGAAVGSGDLRPGTLRTLVRLLREHGCF
jgi:mannose-6-phosphate isomerase-like protein (cupin superfamily)